MLCRHRVLWEPRKYTGVNGGMFHLAGGHNQTRRVKNISYKKKK